MKMHRPYNFFIIEKEKKLNKNIFQILVNFGDGSKIISDFRREFLKIHFKNPWVVSDNNIFWKIWG